MSFFSNHKGMTMIEVLVAMGIFLLVIGGIAEIMIWGNHGKDVVWEQLSTQNEGRKVVQDFVNDLRRANASSIGAYPLELAQSQEIVFYSNVDTDSWRERVHYFLQGTTLKRGLVKPSGNPLAYNTSTEIAVDVAHDLANGANPIFYYYDQSYDGITTSSMSYPINISAVRMAGIKLMLEEKPNVAPAPFNIEAKTEIRNLKNN
jgi:prepilin-type N-terminal cleavage/methylation domain-containing protein